MTYAHITRQLLHMPGMEHIPDQSVILAQKKPVTITGHDPGSILTAMLESGQRIIYLLIDVLLTDDSDNTAHVFKPVLRLP